MADIFVSYAKTDRSLASKLVAISLVLLIALNELSKLGLDVTAPKLQG